MQNKELSTTSTPIKSSSVNYLNNTNQIVAINPLNSHSRANVEVNSYQEKRERLADLLLDNVNDNKQNESWEGNQDNTCSNRNQERD